MIALHLAGPDAGVGLLEEGITFGRQIDLCDDKPVGPRHRLPVDLCPAGNEDFPLLAGGGQSRFKRGRMLAAGM
jgi:hypothetical protein